MFGNCCETDGWCQRHAKITLSRFTGELGINQQTANGEGIAA